MPQDFGSRDFVELPNAVCRVRAPLPHPRPPVARRASTVDVRHLHVPAKLQCEAIGTMLRGAEVKVRRRKCASSRVSY